MGLDSGHIPTSILMPDEGGIYYALTVRHSAFSMGLLSCKQDHTTMQQRNYGKTSNTLTHPLSTVEFVLNPCCTFWACNGSGCFLLLDIPTTGCLMSEKLIEISSWLVCKAFPEM